MRQLDLKNTHVIRLAATVLGCVIAVSGNILAGWFQQYVLDKTFALVSLASIFVLTIVGFFVGMWLEHRIPVIPIKKTTYWMLFTLVTGTIVLATTLSWVYAILRPPTTYFLIDATEQIQPFFNSVRTQVGLAALPNAQVGLSIYGGNISGSAGCGRAKQVIEPNVYADPKTKLDSVLSSVEPGGHSSLMSAMLDTLKTLAKRDEPIKLFVITSGTDSQCDPPDSRMLGGLEKAIKSNINVVIISIGELSSHESDKLEQYATALQGGYWNIHTPAQLPQAVQGSSSYGSQECV